MNRGGWLPCGGKILDTSNEQAYDDITTLAA
jgi:hypothetical protein